MMKNYSLDSLYIHYPFCRHLCNYCDFFKSVPKSEKDVDNFEKYFLDSFDRHSLLMKEYGYQWSDLETLYIGGGTPSLWGERGAKFLKDFLAKNKIHFKENYEWTLEVNPGTWTKNSLKAYRDAGVNRFSLGVQSFDEKNIKYLDRVHNIQDVIDTLTYFRDEKLNYSVDLMLGLPFTEKRDVIRELEEILKYRPSHFSVYILTVKDNYKYFHDLPNEEQIEKEYLEVSEYLKSKGHEHYEVSNFAKPGLESIHNFNYWKSKSVAALGPSATGLLSEAGVRYKWQAKKAQIDIEELSKESAVLEEVYLKLRTTEGIDRSLFEDFPELVETWKEADFLRENESKIVLNSRGFLLLDSLINDMFNHGVI